MLSLKEELDIIIAHNRALITYHEVGLSLYLLNDSQNDITCEMNSRQSRDCGNDIASTMLQDLSNQVEAVRHVRKEIKDQSGVANTLLNTRDITELNDALRSCGMEPLPRNADIRDALCYSIRAIHELGSRPLVTIPSEPTKRMNLDQQADACGGPKSIIKQSEFDVMKLNDDYEATLNENKELRKLVMQWRSEANSLSHLLKAKENELGKLQTLFKDKIADDDRRSALSMTTIRDQNMPHSSLIVLNNMQKRISELEQENACLLKRNSRVPREERPSVVAQLDQAKNQLADVTKKYYDLVEESNEARKNDSDEIVSKLVALVGEDPKQAVKTVQDMKKLVTEIFPPINVFVTRITRMVDPGISGPITQSVLTTCLNRVVQWAQDSADYTALTTAKNDGPLSEQERLDFCRLKALEINIRETFGIAETQIDSLIPYLGRVKFKCDEFRNFYKQACIELGLPVKDKQALPTYAAFMDAFKKRLVSGKTKR